MVSTIIDDILNGEITNYIVAHGRSQYSGTGGPSACGLAAMNCARVVLQKELAGVRGDALLGEMMKESTTDEILSICDRWSSESHLEVEDITRSPVFQRSLNLLVIDYGQSQYNGFTRLLQRLHDETYAHSKSSCAIITRPPEIIACFCIHGPGVPFYVIFDSHPRPGMHPTSAAFIFNSTILATATYLSSLLRYDHSLVANQGLQWQAQLLGNFSGHLFVAREQPAEDSVEYWMDTAMDASLEALALRADKAQLAAESDSLRADVARLRAQLAALQRPRRTPTVTRETRQTHPDAHPDGPRAPRRDSLLSSLVQQGSSAIAAARAYASRQSSAPHSPVSPGRKGKGEERARSSGDDSTFDDLAFALAQQRMYDEEDLASGSAAAAHADRPLPALPTFECNICFDQHSHEDVAQVEGCAHLFCRDCIRGHITTQLEQRQYPITCPLCSADKGECEPSTLGEEFVQQVGLSEKQYATFVELQMAPFSILLHCRGCDNSFFVAKDELALVNIVSCPLPGCRQSWCKACNQLLDHADEEHSCDGTRELQRLMGAKGWKYCPGCRTPAEKIDGCNHMACKSPGCRTHFCYTCGQAIIESIVAPEIDRAVALHYQSCQMFNAPDERDDEDPDDWVDRWRRDV